MWNPGDGGDFTGTFSIPGSEFGPTYPLDSVPDGVVPMETDKKHNPS